MNHRLAVAAVSTNGLLRATAILVELAGTLALARMLGPLDFGRVSLVHLLCSMLRPFHDLGLTVTSARLASPSSWVDSQLATRARAAGIALTMITSAFGYGLAAAMSEPEFAHWTLLASPQFAFAGLVAGRRARLLRAARMARIGSADIIGALLACSLAIGLASRGRGLLGLAMLPTVTQLGSNAVLWAFRETTAVAEPRSSTLEMRELKRFGRRFALAAFVDGVGGLADRMMVGALCGPAALGIYGRSQRLASMPAYFARRVVGEVALPHLSREHARGAPLLPSFISFARLLVAFLVPSSVALWLLTPALVILALGERWADAIPLLRIAIPGAVAYGFQELLAWANLSRSAATRHAVWSTARVGALALTSAVLGAHGVVAVAIGVLVTEVTLLLIGLGALGSEVLRYRMDAVRVLGPVVGSSIAATAVVVVVDRITTVLILRCAVGFAVFACVAFVAYRRATTSPRTSETL